MRGRGAVVAAVLGAAIAIAGVGSPAAATVPDRILPYPILPYPIVRTHRARLTGTFLMHGRITAAVGVRGERAGERITRRWVFATRGCGPITCRRVLLDRQRSAGRSIRILLRRDADGTYRGRAEFFAPLRCLGVIYRDGETARYTISVRITRAYVVDGVRRAATITARYRSTQRIDHTRCPLGPSHDAARYRGVIQPAVYG